MSEHPSADNDAPVPWCDVCDQWPHAVDCPGMPTADYDAPALLNVRDAARRLQVHENTVRNWAADGTLTDARVPGTAFLRLHRAEVDALAAGQHAAAVSTATRDAEAAIAELRVVMARAQAFLDCVIPPDMTSED